MCVRAGEFMGEERGDWGIGFEGGKGAIREKGALGHSMVPETKKSGTKPTREKKKKETTRKSFSPEEFPQFCTFCPEKRVSKNRVCAENAPQI